jgi:hypothetical protein
VEKNILYQDNQSAILLEKNGKKSSSKRTRALNIRYFFIADQVEKGHMLVEYCPTGEMVADFMSKPLQGKLFVKFRDFIMGVSSQAKVSDDRSVLDDKDGVSTHPGDQKRAFEAQVEARKMPVRSGNLVSEK